MDLHFLLGFLTCTLRNWNPRPACGTAFSSEHPSGSARVSPSVSRRLNPFKCAGACGPLVLPHAMKLWTRGMQSLISSAYLQSNCCSRCLLSWFASMVVLMIAPKTGFPRYVFSNCSPQSRSKHFFKHLHALGRFTFPLGHSFTRGK